jgi:nuclear transport factor 2 (NTF2) superfamily protein
LGGWVEGDFNAEFAEVTEKRSEIRALIQHRWFRELPWRIEKKTPASEGGRYKEQ